MALLDLAAFALGSTLMLPVTSDTVDAPAGLWLTAEETAVIRIERCDDELCGAIHWLAEGGLRFDEENPEREFRDRPLCGLEILWGFRENPDRPGEWRDGRVYAADEGSTYRGRIRVEASDQLDLRGYRGISLFGRSQSWTRVSADDFPQCDVPPETRGDG